MVHKVLLSRYRVHCPDLLWWTYRSTRISHRWRVQLYSEDVYPAKLRVLCSVPLQRPRRSYLSFVVREVLLSRHRVQRLVLLWWTLVLYVSPICWHARLRSEDDFPATFRVFCSVLLQQVLVISFPFPGLLVRVLSFYNWLFIFEDAYNICILIGEKPITPYSQSL